MKKQAKDTLAAAGISIGQEFGSLTPDQLAALSAEAETAYLKKHGSPMPADNSSYIRKRYDLLQLRARS